MDHKPQTSQRSSSSETRALVWRSVAMGFGFLLAMPLFFILFGMT